MRDVVEILIREMPMLRADSLTPHDLRVLDHVLSVIYVKYLDDYERAPNFGLGVSPNQVPWDDDRPKYKMD